MLESIGEAPFKTPNSRLSRANLLLPNEIRFKYGSETKRLSERKPSRTMEALPFSCRLSLICEMLDGLGTIHFHRTR